LLVMYYTASNLLESEVLSCKHFTKTIVSGRLENDETGRFGNDQKPQFCHHKLSNER